MLDKCSVWSDTQCQKVFWKSIHFDSNGSNHLNVLPYFRKADYSLGIFQSIGFKEFHDYLLLDEDKKQTEIGKAHYIVGRKYICLELATLLGHCLQVEN